MKLVILQEKLKEGLKIIERIFPKSLSLPILNNVLIKAEKNFLNLAITDLEIGIKYWTLAKIEKEGELLIPTLLFSNLFNLLPNKQLEFQKKDDFLMVKCDNYSTKIKTFSTEDYPLFPETIKDNYFEIESEIFCKGLEQVVEITSLQSRPEFSGVYIIVNKEVIKLVTTDSFRLGEKTLFAEKLKTIYNLSEKEVAFILPQKTAKEVINIFKPKKGRLRIYLSPNHILFERMMEEIKHPEIQLTSRLIEGEYPAYQEIIPKKYETQIILNKNEFVNQLKIASVFSDKNNEIKIKIEPKKEEITISSRNFDYGEYESLIKGKIKGKPLEIFFNHRFLIHGLALIETNEVFFGLNNEESPAVLKPVDDQTYLYIVMPINPTIEPVNKNA